MRIGVDVGGTFTDVVVEDDTGGWRAGKVPSTPPVLDGRALAAQDLGTDRAGLLAATGHFVHRTTVTTNVVLTRSGEYAVGNVAAAATGMVYGGAGGTLGPVMVFARKAGRAAAGR